MGEKFNNEQEERQFRQFQEYQNNKKKRRNVKRLAIRLRWLFSFININYCRYFSMYCYYYRWIGQ